jgi:hypothetical protein
MVVCDSDKHTILLSLVSRRMPLRVKCSNNGANAAAMRLKHKGYFLFLEHD